MSVNIGSTAQEILNEINNKIDKTTSAESLKDYLPLLGGTMTGAITLPENTLSTLYSVRSGWQASQWHTNKGDEAMIFQQQNPRQSWIFRYGTDTTPFTEITPSMQIKNGGVAINKLFATGTTAPITYNLDVNGTANATTIYENGTALSEKYAGKSNVVTTNTDQTIEGKKHFKTGSGYSTPALATMFFGPSATTGFAFGNDGLQTFSNGSYSTMYINNYGGNVDIGKAGSTANVNLYGTVKENGVALSEKYALKTDVGGGNSGGGATLSMPRIRFANFRYNEPVFYYEKSAEFTGKITFSVHIQDGTVQIGDQLQICKMGKTFNKNKLQVFMQKTITAEDIENLAKQPYLQITTDDAAGNAHGVDTNRVFKRLKHNERAVGGGARKPKYIRIRRPIYQGDREVNALFSNVEPVDMRLKFDTI